MSGWMCSCGQYHIGLEPCCQGPGGMYSKRQAEASFCQNVNHLKLSTFTSFFSTAGSPKPEQCMACSGFSVNVQWMHEYKTICPNGHRKRSRLVVFMPKFPPPSGLNSALSYGRAYSVGFLWGVCYFCCLSVSFPGVLVFSQG